eukprot:3233161-Heterocapsa_arctica.AAC.1
MPAAAAYPVNRAGGRPPMKMPLSHAQALTRNASETRRMPSISAGIAPLETGNSTASAQSSGPHAKT